MYRNPFDIAAEELRAENKTLRERLEARTVVSGLCLVLFLLATLAGYREQKRANILESRVRAQEAIQPINEVLSQLFVRDFTSTWCWDVPTKEPGTVEAACWFRFPERRVEMP